jgi:ATP-dependent RNA helicase DeaD
MVERPTSNRCKLSIQKNGGLSMKSFSDLNLSSELMKSIEEQGYTAPTPIQEMALPILLGENTDFLGLAATGTGKTAAFGIPLIEKIDTSLKAVQSLILCPTRELAMQVSEQITILGKYKGVKVITVYGGASYDTQIRGLRSGAQVVVGTPGRVVDLLDRKNLNLTQIKTLILDEADEMISMGFRDELESVMKSIPEEQRNIWFFSATMDKQVSRVVDTYLKNPKQVQINRKEVLSATIKQYFYPVRESDKPEILCKLIESADEFYGIIFCQTKQMVSDLTNYLNDRGYRVDCLHGDKTQSAREQTMQSFRDRRVRILVCTDVAARGLDVKDITHVVNYSLPRELENYVHRIGRTARSGKEGTAMNLVTPSHRGLVYRIEDMTKSRMIEGKIPSRKEIGTKKVAKVLPKFNEQNFFERAQEIMGDDWKTAIATMTTEEVAARFLAMMMPDLFIDKDKPSVMKVSGESQDGRGRRGGDRGESRGGDRGGYSRGGGYGRRGGSSDRGASDRGEGRGGGYGRRDSDRGGYSSRGSNRSGDQRQEVLVGERSAERREDSRPARRPSDRFETNSDSRSEGRSEVRGKFRPSFKRAGGLDSQSGRQGDRRNDRRSDSKSDFAGSARRPQK